MSFPVRVDRYEIVADSGGVGRHRGGCGVERVWRILGNSSQASVCLERTKSAPFGLAGGGAGGAGRIAVIGPDGAERELNSKGSFTAAPGAQICMRAPGAGGFGPPGERDADRLRDDVINGYVSPEAASDYGYRDRDALVCPACRASGASH
jgi:N-methylhydantoinase B